MNSDSHLYTELSGGVFGKLKAALHTKGQQVTEGFELFSTGKPASADSALKCTLFLTPEKGKNLRDQLTKEIKDRAEKFIKNINELTAKNNENITDANKSVSDKTAVVATNVAGELTPGDAKSIIQDCDVAVKILKNVIKAHENAAKEYEKLIKEYDKTKSANVPVSVRCKVSERVGSKKSETSYTESAVIKAVKTGNSRFIVDFESDKSGKTKARKNVEIDFANVCIESSQSGQAGGAMRSAKNENISDTSDAAICE